MSQKCSLSKDSSSRHINNNFSHQRDNVIIITQDSDREDAQHLADKQTDSAKQSELLSNSSSMWHNESWNALVRLPLCPPRNGWEMEMSEIHLRWSVGAHRVISQCQQHVNYINAARPSGRQSIALVERKCYNILSPRQPPEMTPRKPFRNTC